MMQSLGVKKAACKSHIVYSYDYYYETIDRISPAGRSAGCTCYLKSLKTSAQVVNHRECDVSIENDDFSQHAPPQRSLDIVLPQILHHQIYKQLPANAEIDIGKL